MNPVRSEAAGKRRRPGTDLLLFALFLLLGDRLVHFGLMRWEARLAQHDSRLDLFQGPGALPGYDILVLGTSRTFEGVHPYYLIHGLKKTVFKEAYVGKGPRYNYHFYREFKKRFPVPKLVIYGIDHFIYGVRSSRLLQARLGVRPEREGRGMRPLLLLSEKPRVDDVLLRTLALIESECLGRRSGHDRDQAFMASYVGSPARRQVVENRPLRFPRYRFRRFPGREGEFLKRLLQELRQDRVPICLLILPDHAGTLASNRGQGMFRKELKRLSREFTNAFVCDLGDPRVFPVGRSDYFLNGGYGQANSHLSRAGAALLNELLVRALKTRLAGP